MNKIFGSLRLKVLILLVLVGLTSQMGWNVKGTEACQECVKLTGGLCVGCMSGSGTHSQCTALQESCTCVTSGTCLPDGS